MVKDRDQSYALHFSQYTWMNFSLFFGSLELGAMLVESLLEQLGMQMTFFCCLPPGVGCFRNFYRSVRYGAALEVKTLACLAAADVKSTTESNLSNLTREFEVDPSEDALKCRKIILDNP